MNTSSDEKPGSEHEPGGPKVEYVQEDPTSLPRSDREDRLIKIFRQLLSRQADGKMN
jgi:hypothetical protein